MSFAHVQVNLVQAGRLVESSVMIPVKLEQLFQRPFSCSSGVRVSVRRVQDKYSGSVDVEHSSMASNIVDFVFQLLEIL
jgi:hypothetical protein